MRAKLTDKAKNMFIVLKDYYKKYEQFPQFDYIEFHTGFERHEIISLLRELEDKGMVKRKYAKRTIPETKLQTETTLQEKTVQTVSTIMNKIPKKVNINILLFFKVIAVIVGSIASFLSVYFTYLWLKYTLNDVFSFLLSFSMILFSIIAFQAIILFKTRKKYFLVGLFFVLWVIVLLFSMSSTVAGQYNKLLQTKIEKQKNNIEDNNKILLYNEYEEKIKELKIDLESVRKEREKLQEFLNECKMNSKEYKDLNYRIYLKNTRIDYLRGHIQKMKNKKIELLQNDVKLNVVKDVSFFDWVSSILNINTNIIQFWLSLFPAVFIDIVAPLSFALVMFLKKEN